MQTKGFAHQLNIVIAMGQRYLRYGCLFVKNYVFAVHKTQVKSRKQERAQKINRKGMGEDGKI